MTFDRVCLYPCSCACLLFLPLGGGEFANVLRGAVLGDFAAHVGLVLHDGCALGPQFFPVGGPCGGVGRKVHRAKYLRRHCKQFTLSMYDAIARSFTVPEPAAPSAIDSRRG